MYQYVHNQIVLGGVITVAANNGRALQNGASLAQSLMKVKAPLASIPTVTQLPVTAAGQRSITSTGQS